MNWKKHLPGIVIAAVLVTVAVVYETQRDSDFLEETPGNNLVVLKTYEYKDRSVVAEHLEAMRYYRKGDFNSAKNIFEDIVSKAPDEPNAHYNLGMMLIRLEDYAGAEFSLKKALKLAPGSAPAHLGLGSLASRRKQYDLAIEHYQLALDDRPAFSNAHYEIANVYFKVKRYSLAEKHYNKVIKLIPGTHMAKKSEQYIMAIKEYNN